MVLCKIIYTWEMLYLCFSLSCMIFCQVISLQATEQICWPSSQGKQKTYNNNADIAIINVYHYQSLPQCSYLTTDG